MSSMTSPDTRRAARASGTRSHGALSRYTADGCRCQDCRAAKLAYMTRRRRLIAYGRWQPLVDAEPARRHVHQLMAHGLARRHVAALAGVQVRTVTVLLYGKPANDQPPSRRIRPATASALLSVRPHQLPSTGWVPATGTRRRLQALAIMGWPTREIAARLGTHPTYMRRLMHAEQVTAERASRTRDVYDQLWHVPGPSPRTRSWAIRQGWRGPLDWDDDRIDNPHATPATPQVTTRSRNQTRYADSQELLNQGLTLAEVARRLGVSPATLRRSRQRAQAHARAASGVAR